MSGEGSNPQLLTYSTIVAVDMDSTNGVNLADVNTYGHRIVIDVSRSAINAYLGWKRLAGSSHPTAFLDLSAEPQFREAVSTGLGGGFTDIDGVVDGLHFGTATMNLNPDGRLRADGLVTANDIPLSFVLYKLYGSSSTETLGRIYNLEDAHGMLSNQTIVDSIVTSFQTEESAALNTMFRDLLAANPQRFFDASGQAPPGLFETATDVSGQGAWSLVAEDTFEITMKLIFHSQVTKKSAAHLEPQIVIAPNDYFFIRLHLKAVD